MNFKELGGIRENHQILSPKIAQKGGGVFGHKLTNFRKNGVGAPVQLATVE